MRYTLLTSRTFHNRITKDLGVLVGAALVATLGLPSAVQAQTTSAPTMVSYDDGTDAFTVERPHPIIGGDTHWVLEVDGPVSVPDMVKMNSGGDDPFESNGFTVQAKGNDGRLDVSTCQRHRRR